MRSGLFRESGGGAGGCRGPAASASGMFLWSRPRDWGATLHPFPRAPPCPLFSVTIGCPDTGGRWRLCVVGHLSLPLTPGGAGPYGRHHDAGGQQERAHAGRGAHNQPRAVARACQEDGGLLSHHQGARQVEKEAANQLCRGRVDQPLPDGGCAPRGARALPHGQCNEAAQGREADQHQLRVVHPRAALPRRPPGANGDQREHLGHNNGDGQEGGGRCYRLAGGVPC